MIEAIGLDADDTLWENETFFRVTEAESGESALQQLFYQLPDLVIVD